MNGVSKFGVLQFKTNPNSMLHGVVDFFNMFNFSNTLCWSLCYQLEACCYTPNEELDFLRQYLGPQLRRDHPDVKIMIYDHNKVRLMNIFSLIELCHSPKQCRIILWIGSEQFILILLVTVLQMALLFTGYISYSLSLNIAWHIDALSFVSTPVHNLNTWQQPILCFQTSFYWQPKLQMVEQQRHFSFFLFFIVFHVELFSFWVNIRGASNFWNSRLVESWSLRLWHSWRLK
jgi:hypothetical protein